MAKYQTSLMDHKDQLVASFVHDINYLESKLKSLLDKDTMHRMLSAVSPAEKAEELFQIMYDHQYLAYEFLDLLNIVGNKESVEIFMDACLNSMGIFDHQLDTVQVEGAAAYTGAKEFIKGEDWENTRDIPQPSITYESSTGENIPPLPEELKRLLKNTEESYKPQEDEDAYIIEMWKGHCLSQKIRKLPLQDVGITNLADLFRYLKNPRELNVKPAELNRPRSIYFCFNEKTEADFKETHANFFSDFSNNSESVWAFHGTTKANADSIVDENFDLNKLRRQAYGQGIYFSSYYDVSKGYGSHVLLCKIIVGYCTLHEDRGDGYKNSYDTKLVNANKGEQAGMLVVKNPGQIRPLFVLEP